MKSEFFRVWSMPILLAILTTFGLLAALIGTGAWHVLSWIALLVPVATCFRFGIFPRNRYILGYRNSAPVDRIHY